MMSAAGLPQNLREVLWAEAASTATMVTNQHVRDGATKSPSRIFWNQDSDPAYARNLRIFGESCIIANRTKIKGKLQDRGDQGIFLGYSYAHASNVYRFYKFSTRSVVISRDVTFLNDWYYKPTENQRKFGDYPESAKATKISKTDAGNAKTVTFETEPVEINETSTKPASTTLKPDIKSPDPPEKQQNDSKQLQDQAASNELSVDTSSQLQGKQDTKLETPAQTRSTGDVIPKPLRWFQSPTFDALPGNVRELYDDKNPLVDEFIGYAFVGAVNSGYQDPNTYDEAMNGSEAPHWTEGMNKEFNSMRQKDVWDVINKSDVPKDRRLLSAKWVFKKKKDGRYRARLVARGYNQIPGVDFTDSFSPVISDIAFRIILIQYLQNGWDSEMIDVETAFLYGELEEEIYMEIPDGMDEDKSTKCLKLKKSIYGLVQAARQWWKTFTTYMVKTHKFQESKADPCLLMRTNEFGTVFFVLYVDDCFLVGDRKAIDKAVQDIEERFTITKSGNMTEYVGCKIIPTKDGKGVYLHQPDLIESLDTFELPSGKIPLTPGTPGKILSRATETEDLLSGKEQRLYRSLCGKLLYLIKHSRPDIANAIRECSKHMDLANKEHLRELYKITMYVKHTKERGLYMRPKRTGKKDRIWCMSDSSFADDVDNRISTMGYIIYYEEAATAWRSKGQPRVTLSSSEAEYIALVFAVMELLFIKSIVESTGREVELPMLALCDNLGAVSMATTKSTRGRTRHIDTKHHFIRELIEDGIIKVEFVPTADNQADIFTKNTAPTIHHRLSQSFVRPIQP